MLKSFATALLVLAVTFQASEASAQAQPTDSSEVITTPGHRLNGNVAGTIGLGLLGAEVGLILTPTFGLQDHWWAWVLFPTVGAAGGAVAGALAFDPHDPGPKVTLTLMGVGMALVVPAIVGAMALKDRKNNRALENRLEGGGAIRLSKKGTRFGVPDVGATPVYTAAEQQRFGVTQRSAYQISLVSGRF
ncbi:MAG: hypothetical protein QM778_03200 [Myxococcales bacterium]